MTWVVLASILLFEASAVICLLQALANCFGVWLRWLLWFAMLLASLFAFAWVLSAIDEAVVRNSATWPRGRSELSFRAPFQTYRLMLISSAAGPAAFLLILAMASLLRERRGGLRLLFWTTSWRSSRVALLIASSVLLIALVVNDRWVCHRVGKFAIESLKLGAIVEPPPCEDAENGADILRPTEELSQSLIRRGLPDPQENFELLRGSGWTEYLARNAPIAQRARDAASRRCWRLDGDSFEPDMAAEHPEVLAVADCTRLLLYEGHRALLDGNKELALSNAEALRRIAEQLIRDPRETSHSVAIAADSAASRLIEHLLYVYRPSAEDVTRLIQPGFEFRKSLIDYCTWQQAEHYHALSQYYFGLLATPEERRLPGFRFLHEVILANYRLLYAHDDLHELPKMFAEIKRQARLSYPELLAENNKVKYFFFDPTGGATVTCLATGIYTPIAMHSAAEMRRRLCDFALVLSQRGLVDEILSENPADVVPPDERPLDLFDGKPIRITRSDGGVVIYSVDLYGEDDGGTEGIPASVSGKGYLRDMTFCLGEAYKTRRLTPPKKQDEI